MADDILELFVGEKSFTATVKEDDISVSVAEHIITETIKEEQLDGFVEDEFKLVV
jgi:hypothetical protein